MNIWYHFDLSVQLLDGPLCMICVYQTKHYHLIRVTCSFPSNLKLWERAESIIEYTVSSIWDHSIRNGGVKRQVFLSAKINGVEITVPIFILQSSSFRKKEYYIASIQTHSKKWAHTITLFDHLSPFENC